MTYISKPSRARSSSYIKQLTPCTDASVNKCGLKISYTKKILRCSLPITAASLLEGGY
jgi:hypothetical protein